MSIISNRDIFFKYVAQTSPAPIGLEIVQAEGVYQYDAAGRKYIDLISGFSVANIGHSHPKVIKAVQEQAARYMHLIVYGEFIESPQTAYANLLVQHLPSSSPRQNQISGALLFVLHVNCWYHWVQNRGRAYAL